MKPGFVLGCAALLVCGGSTLADGTLQFQSIGDGYRHWGGIFNFQVQADSASHGYDGTDWNTITNSLGGGYTTNQWAGEQIENGIGSSFQTFCLETGVDLGHLGGYFHGVMSSTVDSGTGFGDWGASATPHTTLEAQTAFLYSSFRSGTLGSVAGWNAASAESQANALQGAIWLFQEQVDQNFVDTNGDGGQYTPGEVSLIAALQSYANANGNTAYWAAGGDVRVLNLSWGAYPGSTTEMESQSVLVISPVAVPLPIGGAMAGAGLLGLAGFKATRRGRA